jgi:hypothetical protein
MLNKPSEFGIKDLTGAAFSVIQPIVQHWSDTLELGGA